MLMFLGPCFEHFWRFVDEIYESLPDSPAHIAVVGNRAYSRAAGLRLFYR